MKKPAIIAITATVVVLALIAVVNQDKIKEEKIRFPFQMQKAKLFLEHLPDALDDLIGAGLTPQDNRAFVIASPIMASSEAP